jgi:Family of unknown function (DUF6424)
MTAAGEHAEREDHAWAVEIPDHPGRTESGDFRAAKTAEHKILAAVRAEPGGCELLAAIAGDGATQAHHAGSLWVFTGGTWRLLLNICGVEWSAQFAASPERVDALRRNAAWLYERFPETLDELDRLGYHQARAILSEPVTDAAGVARWTDSLFNSCVPLTAGLHQAILSPAHPQTGGWHHYPKPIWDQQVTKRDDFSLWVTDEDGHEVAVAPVAQRGSGDGRVEVQWAHPLSRHHAEHRACHARGERYILPGDHDLAKQAFAQQA